MKTSAKNTDSKRIQKRKNGTSLNAMNNESNQKRKKGDVLVLRSNDEDSSDGFAINEIDYRVMTEIWSAIYKDEPINLGMMRSWIKIAEDDGERRVWHLNILNDSELITSIPDSIGNLTQLIELHIDCYAIECLPSSIWRLQNLTNLRLSEIREIVLAKEMWDLVNLKELSLEFSDITSLSPFIGKLRNLEVLDLSCTENLENLPDEIGNLASLKTLNLYGSDIKCLPPSVEKLQNLKTSNLYGSDIKCLPPCIEKLQNLKTLDLRGIDIKSLPPCIGKLQNLRKLCLSSSMTVSSGLLKKLTGLMALDVYNTNVLYDNSQYTYEFLFELVAHCPMLGELVSSRDRITYEEERKLGFALACNRARYLIGFCAEDKEPSGIRRKLWPQVLKNASGAFDRNDPLLHGKGGYTFFKYNPSQPDAIYQLLVDFRESFVGILVSQTSMDVPKASSGT